MLRRLIVSLATVLAVGIGIRTDAGGVLETLDITGNVPSPIPGQIIANIIGMKWDVRSIPVQYRINSIDNPIPNPLGPAFLTVRMRPLCFNSPSTHGTTSRRRSFRCRSSARAQQHRPGRIRHGQRADVPWPPPLGDRVIAIGDVDPRHSVHSRNEPRLRTQIPMSLRGSPSPPMSTAMVTSSFPQASTRRERFSTTTYSST